MDDRGDEDDSEEEEEEEAGDDNEFIDLPDVLDEKGGMSTGSNSDDSASEEKLDFDPSDDEEMPEALDYLNDFVSNLDVTSTKRKATEDPSEVGASRDTRARKRHQLVNERTEAGAENEFRARSSGNFFYYFLHYSSFFLSTHNSQV